MKIKVIKKRKKEIKTQNSNQLELSFIDSSKKKNKNIIQAQTINSISRIFLSSLVLGFVFLCSTNFD
jgi:Bax protein